MWFMMLDEGRGGFIDFSKYKEALVNIFWAGAEKTESQAMRELRELREMMGGGLEPDPAAEAE
jgi:hypothetical protein